MCCTYGIGSAYSNLLYVLLLVGICDDWFEVVVHHGDTLKPRRY